MRRLNHSLAGLSRGKLKNDFHKLTSGSSVVVREMLDSDFVDYFAKQGLAPSKLETLAYSYQKE